MIPRFLNLQGMIGIAASLLLLGLFAVKAAEARRWHKQADRFEAQYLAEQSARVGTIANYRAAAEVARKADQANLARVAAEQRTISERTTYDLETRLADARLRAQRLQLDARAPAAPGGGPRAAPVPASGAPAGPAGGPAEEDGFPLSDRLLATEQAIQLDELIKWVTGQAAIDNGDPKSGSAPSPSVRGPGEH
jgi:hypothetical protein